MLARKALFAISIMLLCGLTVVTTLMTPQRTSTPMPDSAREATAYARSAAPPSQTAAVAHRSVVTARRTSAEATFSESRRGDLDQVEARAQVEANIATLDARFAAEPIDSAWAMREERALRQFFSADALVSQGLPSPIGVETACHSATCRVSARFAGPIEAEMTTQAIAMRLAARLPYGAVMPRALNDGSIQVDAWYSANRITL